MIASRKFTDEMLTAARMQQREVERQCEQYEEDAIFNLLFRFGLTEMEANELWDSVR